MAKSAAYRKASVGTGLFYSLALLAVAGMHAVIFWMISARLDRTVGWLAFPIGFAPLVIGLVTGWVLVARKNRKRVALLAPRLERLNFRPLLKPDEGERERFAAPLAHLLLPTFGLKQGAGGIQWLAEEQSAGAKTLLFEHEYVTGSGKTFQEHHHTVLAWPAGHPDLRAADGLAAASWFFMARYPWFQRRALRERMLQQPEFAELAPLWVLLGDAATGARFLSPAARRALALSPKDEVWSVGTGWVVCAFKGTLDADNFERFLAHTRGVLAAPRP